MTVMSGHLYRALQKANVPDDLAQKAAEEVADYNNRLNLIDGKLTLLTWMVGTLLAANIALVLKAYF